MGLGNNLFQARKKKEFDIDVKEIQEMIDKTSEKISDKIDWTKAWGKKYPILTQYQSQVDISFYASELRRLLNDIEKIWI